MDQKNPIDRRAFLGAAAAGVGLAATGSIPSPIVDAGDVVMSRESAKQFVEYHIACKFAFGTKPTSDGRTEITWLENLDPSKTVVIHIPIDES